MQSLSRQLPKKQRKLFFKRNITVQEHLNSGVYAYLAHLGLLEVAQVALQS